MCLSSLHQIVLPVYTGTGSSVTHQVAWRLAIMAAILVNLSRHSLEDARGPPRALTNILEHRVRLGDRLRLTCPVESDPPSFVEWFKDGRSIHHIGWERFRVARNQSLTISNFSSVDRGSYVCRATNGFGSVEIRHQVLLNGSSSSLRSKVEPETYLTPTVGGSVRLICRLPTGGSHDGKVTWYKDGVVLSSAFDLDNDDVMSDASLTLRDVTMADSGVYECRDPNGANEGNVTYVVDVIEDKSSKPSFIEAPKNVIASSTGTATFYCHVRSDTVPHIQWLKRVEETEDMENAVLNNPGVGIGGGGVGGGRVLHIDQERFQVLSGMRSVSRPDGSYLSKLLIRNVRDEDAGLYLCTCTNNHGYIVSRAHLAVRPEADIGSSSEDDDDDEAKQHDDLSSQHQDIPVLSLFAVLAVLTILVLFSLISYAVYRSRFGAKSTTTSSSVTSSSSAIVDLPRRWAALPAADQHHHFRGRSTSASLLPAATPQEEEDEQRRRRGFECHRYAVVTSKLDEQRWTPSIPVDLCTLRSNSPNPRSVYSPVATYLPVPRRTAYSPTTLGSGYSDCASAARRSIAEMTSQFDIR